MAAPSEKATARNEAAGVGHQPTTGVVVLGGNHPGLAIARSLGRRGIPVYVLDDQRCIASCSKYVTRVVKVRNILDERETVDAALELGRKFHLRDWVLFPTRDETVAAFSQHRDKLAEFYKVTTGDWASVEWAWDKAKTYELAGKLGIPHPQTFVVKGIDELKSLNARLPLAVKPAIKENFFYATGAKAWRADTAEELERLYRQATRHIPPEEILIQEIIPGDGRAQYSYCAFFQNGRPHSTLIARRARQHPREFGRAATYVETIEEPAIEELSERFLKAISYHGLVEIEYKRDPRDGKYKLLDVNARAWGFHGLGAACGVDFPYLAYADQMGWPIASARAKAGAGWVRILTDIPTALSDLAYGSLSLGAYIQSMRTARTESVFSWDDPLPYLAEIAMLPYFVLRKYVQAVR
jgi:D-aspartate ligase